MFRFISKTYPDHKLIITGDIAEDGKIALKSKGDYLCLLIQMNR